MDNTKTPSGNPQSDKWIRREDSAEVYSNLYFVNWSRTDLRIRFGQMIPTNDTSTKVSFVVEEKAAVTMSWAQAKALRDSLNDAVERFEKTNGVIDLLNLKLPQ